jgi:hypothetical protein
MGLDFKLRPAAHGDIILEHFLTLLCNYNIKQETWSQLIFVFS